MTKTFKTVYLALLVAQSLALFLFEGLIPLPFLAPGAKLGLANLITLIALYTLPRWQDIFAKTVHAALYLLLIAVPILGITNRMWDPAAWNFLGIPMPHVAVPDKPTARRIQEIHETLGNVLMYLAAFHAAVGLFHHYVQRDNVLTRMLPPARGAAARDTPARARD